MIVVATVPGSNDQVAPPLKPRSQGHSCSLDQGMVHYLERILNQHFGGQSSVSSCLCNDPMPSMPSMSGAKWGRLACRSCACSQSPWVN